MKGSLCIDVLIHCTTVSQALGGGQLVNLLYLCCLLGQNALILMVYGQKGVQGIRRVLALSSIVIDNILDFTGNFCTCKASWFIDE